MFTSGYVLVILLVWETEGGYGIYTPCFGAMPRGRRRPRTDSQRPEGYRQLADDGVGVHSGAAAGFCTGVHDAQAGVHRRQVLFGSGK